MFNYNIVNNSDPICFYIIINIFFRQFGTVLTYIVSIKTHIFI